MSAQPGLTPEKSAKNSAPEFAHLPVLLQAVLDYVPEQAGLLVDCTLGGAGHALAMLGHCSQAELFGADRDPHALAAATEALAPFAERVMLRHAPFAEVGHHVLKGSVDFLLADLGVSSPQLDRPERGFSFSAEGPLDMRMDPEHTTTTAARIINQAKPEALLRLFREFGEERFAPRIVRAIEQARHESPIETTTRLARLVAEAVPRKFHQHGRHPATRIFQALRIEVNGELAQLEALLDHVPELLKPGGRVAIISFHSLEDRRVKERFKSWESPCTCPPRMPLCTCGKKPIGRRLTRKPVTASDTEAQDNPRARSAKMRVFEKTEAPEGRLR